MAKAKILVVDDSNSVRRVLERLLVSRGFEVIGVEGAQEALERLQAEPDLRLVLADVIMPGIDGFEFCRSLASKIHDPPPVILISGIVDEGVMRRAHEVGATAVVAKPFTPEELFPKIEQALQASLLVPSKPQGPDLKGELQPFLEHPEVRSVALFDREGQILVEMGRPLSEASMLGAYLKTLFSIAGVLGAKYQVTPLEAMSLEYGSQTWLLQGIQGRWILLLLLQGSGGGVVRHLIRRQLPSLSSALDQAYIAQ
jgi:CheY-like chemotaxis protein